MKVPFVDLRVQYRSLQDEVHTAMERVLAESDFILGRELHVFEEEFAQFCGVRHAVGVDTGLSALELGLRSLGIGPGDEVITAANTFIATASAISFTGARPVLVDIEPETYNLDPNAVEETITNHTKAIMPVHLYGQPADMDPILEIARRHDLFVVEDACQAHGALYKGRRAGSLGDFAAFSFYPAKNLGAYGDGGILVTDDSDVADMVRMLRNYGQREKYHHALLAFNRRLDTLQAAVLRVKLRYLNQWNEQRRRNATLYSERLGEVVLARPVEAAHAKHVYHLYVVRVRDRDALQRYLKAHDVATGIHYPIPIHFQEAYRELGYQVGDFPVTEAYAGQILSLPMYPELTENQIQYVVDCIKEFYA